MLRNLCQRLPTHVSGLLLAVGPVVVCGLAVWCARVFPLRSLPTAAAENRVWSAAEPLPAATATTTPPGALTYRCHQVAQQWRQAMGPEYHVYERPPLVVVTQRDPVAFAALEAEVLQPAMLALRHAYFSIPPSEPITVLAFPDRVSYEHYASEFFQDEGVSVYGYYKPGHRTLVLNLETGTGTLLHELTHALLAFDFPTAPDWLNEGLASLHEEAEFQTTNGTAQLIGRVNWRLEPLQRAIAAGRLRSVRDLLLDPHFRQGDVALNYAQARYLCLFLQQRGKLAELYAAMRTDSADDPQGERAVLTLGIAHNWEQFDQQFQAWAAQLQP